MDAELFLYLVIILVINGSHVCVGCSFMHYGQDFWIAFWSCGFLDVLFNCWAVENVYISLDIFTLMVTKEELISFLERAVSIGP